MKLTRIALRNVLRNRRRTILSAVAVMVATMAISFLFSLIIGMIDDLEYNTQTFVSGVVRMQHEEYAQYEKLAPTHLVIENTSEVLDRLARVEQVEQVSPRVRMNSRILLEREEYSSLGMGVRFESEQLFQDLDSYLVEGRFPEEGSREAVVGSQLAAELDLGIGDQFTVLVVTSVRSSNAFSLTVVGIAQYPLASVNLGYYIPLETAQRYMYMPDAVNEILIKSEATESAAVAQAVKRELAGYPIAVDRWEDISIIYGLFQSALISYMVIALIFFILGSTVIVNTTMMTIFERMREIGTLEAMGMTGSELVRMFLLEAFYIGLAGALAGMVCGAGIVGYFSHAGLDLSAQLADVDYDISNVIYPQITLFTTFGVFLYSTIVAALASLFPSLRAAKIEPVKALREI